MPKDLDDLVRRLLTLEIDTIVSDGMSAEAMPSDGVVLIRIAHFCKDFLMRAVGELADAGRPALALPDFVGEGATTPFTAWDVKTGGTRTFDALCGAAQVCLAARISVPRPHDLQRGHGALLARVVAFCGAIQFILRRLGLAGAAVDEAGVDWAEKRGEPWPAFDHDALLTLRRIWETGVDVIVAQTLIRLDGGVTTRVLDGWDRPEAAPVLDIHDRAVDIALARWSFLVATARQVAAFFLAATRVGRSRLEAMASWAGSLRRAARLRPRAAAAALATLDELLCAGGVRLACPAPAGGGMGASFGLDGSAFVRFTSVEALVARDGRQALSRFGDRLATAHDALSALSASLDVVVAAATLTGAAVAAASGGDGWAAVLRTALVCGLYGALIPLRTTLVRLVLRICMRAATRRGWRRDAG